MNKLVKIDSHPGLCRDMTTGAILNTDTNALDLYKAERNRILEQNKIKEDISNLQSDFVEMKEMLSQILKAITK